MLSCVRPNITYHQKQLPLPHPNIPNAHRLLPLGSRPHHSRCRLPVSNPPFVLCGVHSIQMPCGFLNCQVVILVPSEHCRVSLSRPTDLSHRFLPIEVTLCSRPYHPLHSSCCFQVTDLLLRLLPLLASPPAFLHLPLHLTPVCLRQQRLDAGHDVALLHNGLAHQDGAAARLGANGTSSGGRGVWR